MPTLDLGIPGLPPFPSSPFPPLPSTPSLPPLPSLLFPSLSPSLFPEPPPPKPARGSEERCKLPQWGLGQSPADKRFGAYLSQKEQLWWQQFLCIFIRINLNLCTNTRLLSSRYSVSLRAKQVKSCVTDKHNTKYNTLISEQPYIHARWSIFTFPGHSEPRSGHCTPWVNFGTIPAIPRRLATLGNFPLCKSFSAYE